MVRQRSIYGVKGDTNTFLERGMCWMASPVTNGDDEDDTEPKHMLEHV